MDIFQRLVLILYFLLQIVTNWVYAIKFRSLSSHTNFIYNGVIHQTYVLKMCHKSIFPQKLHRLRRFTHCYAPRDGAWDGISLLPLRAQKCCQCVLPCVLSIQTIILRFNVSKKRSPAHLREAQCRVRIALSILYGRELTTIKNL